MSSSQNHKKKIIIKIHVQNIYNYTCPDVSFKASAQLRGWAIGGKGPTLAWLRGASSPP